MVGRGKIKKELSRLDYLYKKSQQSKITIENRDSAFFAKLYLIEICGWIEEYMDYVIDVLKKKVSKERCNLDYIEKVKSNNFSFDYDHFLRMLIACIGIYGVERLESKIKDKTLNSFKSSLSVLKKSRDDHAHSFISGTTKKIHAPSFITPHFLNILSGLELFMVEIRK